MRRFSTPVVVALISAIALLGGQPATAGPTHVRSDRTENEIAFSYDASSGDIGTETSSQRDAHEELVRFKVVVRESEDSGTGLIGKLKLRLEDDANVVYDGWFTLIVTGEDGRVAFQRSRPAHIRLTPQPGMSRAAITYRFDLPTGAYTAAGTFEAH